MWHLERFEFEVFDNYQKQSYRNRCFIYGPNGKQMLNIPVSFKTETKRKKTRDARIDYSENWQNQHLKSLETGYNSSPFFEILKPEIEQIFQKKQTFLVDLNIDTFYFVKETLNLNLNFIKTNTYNGEYTQDFRFLANAKTDVNLTQALYHQVFADRFGFIKNLSILDLLFMEGANAISFLEKNHLNSNSPFL